MCDKCSAMISLEDKEVIRERNCPNCNEALDYLISMEFNDNQELVREYSYNGNIIEHKKPIKYSNTNSKPSVTCPYCNSTNCKKLGAISRGVSFGLFGFGSGKIGKQWHCNDCKSDF